MDGDHAPSALNKELHEKAGGGEARLAGGEDPGWDQTCTDQRSADH